MLTLRVLLDSKIDVYADMTADDALILANKLLTKGWELKQFIAKQSQVI